MCANFLPRRYQIDCLCVSKLWHATIAPIVWKSISVDHKCVALGEDGERAPHGALRTYGIYVCYLQFGACKEVIGKISRQVNLLYWELQCCKWYMRKWKTGSNIQ